MAPLWIDRYICIPHLRLRRRVSSSSVGWADGLVSPALRTADLEFSSWAMKHLGGNAHCPSSASYRLQRPFKGDRTRRHEPQFYLRRIRPKDLPVRRAVVEKVTCRMQASCPEGRFRGVDSSRVLKRFGPDEEYARSPYRGW